jgi:hypothetical protein
LRGTFKRYAILPSRSTSIRSSAKGARAQLFAALARRGLVRAESEPLERFAGRLEGPDLGPAAELLRRWAAFRYGEEGDRETLARDLASCAARLGR